MSRILSASVFAFPRQDALCREVRELLVSALYVFFDPALYTFERTEEGEGLQVVCVSKVHLSVPLQAKIAAVATAFVYGTGRLKFSDINWRV
jgi:hypothetical protein